MFDYPLPIPRATLYEELGLQPESTTEEITYNRGERAQEINKQLAQVGSQLAAIYAAVSDLKETEDKIEALRLQNNSGGDELDEYRNKLDRLERLALAQNPEYRRLREQAKTLKQQEQNLNVLPITAPENRLKYDREHPPLELIKLSDCERDELFDRNRGSVAITALRQELSAFLEAQNETVFHPSDLTRGDFSADFSYVPRLDDQDGVFR